MISPSASNFYQATEIGLKKGGVAVLSGFSSHIPRLLFVAILAGIVVFVFYPAVQRFVPALRPSQVVDLAQPGGAAGPQGQTGDQTVKIVTVLSKDAIRSIDEPEFVSPAEASGWMRPEELVIGLSIDGESRAYPITTLSRHEIVNDVVGGKAVAVTL